MLGDSLRRRSQPSRKPPRPEKPRPRSTRTGGRLSWGRWLLYALGILVVSFGVGYLLSTQVLFPAPETAGTGIAVPELYGRTADQARQAVEKAGLVVADTSAMPSMEEPVGTVLAQDPLPGQQLRRGAGVAFTVSSGPPVLRVPAVIGLSRETARELLEGVGFGVATDPVASNLPEGVVASTNPAAGSPERLPAVVTLGISIGPPPPDTLGSALDTLRIGTR